MLSLGLFKKTQFIVLFLGAIAFISAAVFVKLPGADWQAEESQNTRLQTQLDGLLEEGWRAESALMQLENHPADAIPKERYRVTLARLKKDTNAFESLLDKSSTGAEEPATHGLVEGLDLAAADLPMADVAVARLARLRERLMAVGSKLKRTTEDRRRVADLSRRGVIWSVSAVAGVGVCVLLGIVSYARTTRHWQPMRMPPAAVEDVTPVDWKQRFSDQQALYREALQQSKIIGWRADVHDQSTAFDFGSEQQREFYGLRPHMPFEDFRRLIHPDDLAATIVAIEDLIGNESPRYDAYYRMRIPNGEWRLIHSQGRTIVRAADGSSMAAHGFMQDVTDLKNLGEALAIEDVFARVSSAQT